MSRLRVAGGLAIAASSLALGAHVLLGEGFDHWPTRLGSVGPRAEERATEISAGEGQERSPDPQPWRPAPIAFIDAAARLGLPSDPFAGEPSWADLEGDGDPDLFVAGGSSGPCALFLNGIHAGARSFELATDLLKLEAGERFELGAFADFDADGDRDVYLAGAAGTSDRLARRLQNGSFERATEEYGLAAPSAGRTRDCVWGDFDGDGRIDLFVLRDGAPDLLHLRQGGATFAERAREAGVDAPLDASGALAADFDGDRDLDLFLGDRSGAIGDRSFANLGAGTFALEELLPAAERRTASLCAALGDADGDGTQDLFLGCAGGGSRLLRARRSSPGALRFEDATEVAELPAAGPTFERAAFADFDLDGALDLLALGPLGLSLFRNQGDGCFVDVTETAGLSGLAAGGKAFALADFDLDGDVDVAVSASTAPLLLLENRARGAGWLRVAPRGLAGTGGELGASVRVILPDGTRRVRTIDSGRSEPALAIGLAGHSSAVELEILWMSGGGERVLGVPAGAVLEPSAGRPRLDIASHPAALLGEVPAFDLEVAFERAAARVRAGLPPVDPEVAERRTAALIARAQARMLFLEPVDASSPELAAAIDRIGGETRLERLIRAAVQRLRLPSAVIEARQPAAIAAWSRPARVAGTAFVLCDEVEAERARSLALAAQDVARSAVDGPLAGHAQGFIIDVSLWSRLAPSSTAPFAAHALPEPGAVSPLLPLTDGFAFLVVSEVLPPEPISPDAARSLVETRLRRELARAEVDLLLGLDASERAPGTPSRAASPRN